MNAGLVFTLKQEINCKLIFDLDVGCFTEKLRGAMY